MSIRTYFNKKRIKSFIKYHYNRLGVKYDLINLEVSADKVKVVDPEDVAWKAEVVVFRGLRCPECKSSGKCVSCGCPWNGLSQDMSLECDKRRWQDVDSKEHWEEMKEKFGIKLGLVKWEELQN